MTALDLHREFNTSSQASQELAKRIKDAGVEYLLLPSCHPLRSRHCQGRRRNTLLRNLEKGVQFHRTAVSIFKRPVLANCWAGAHKRLSSPPSRTLIASTFFPGTNPLVRSSAVCTSRITARKRRRPTGHRCSWTLDPFA
jgi:hypothetical protein